MKQVLMVLTAGALCFFGPTEGKADDDEALRVLRAENNLLKATVAQRDKMVKDLKAELEALKAKPTEVEIATLRKELSEAKGLITNLQKDLDKAKPVPEKGVKVTDRDLTLESVKKTDYRGAELILNGYCAYVEGKEGKFQATIVAGSEGTDGHQDLWRTEAAKPHRDYQVQVYVTGERAALLTADAARLRGVRGIVREIKVEQGKVFGVYRREFMPPGAVGTVMIVTLDKITMR
jgi:hypothetical protein